MEWNKLKKIKKGALKCLIYIVLVMNELNRCINNDFLEFTLETCNYL